MYPQLWIVNYGENMFSQCIHDGKDWFTLKQGKDRSLSLSSSGMQSEVVWCSVMQCDAVWCSVLQGVAVWCSAMQCNAVRCFVLQCVVVCCSVLQCVAVCCSALQYVAIEWTWSDLHAEVARIELQRFAVCCSALQCVAVCCSCMALPRVAACCSVLQCVAVSWIVCSGVMCVAAVCTRSLLYMGWLRLVGSLRLKVSFAKEPHKRDYILQKRPIMLRSLLIVATPHQRRWHWVTVWCSALRCIGACCSVSQCVAVSSICVHAPHRACRGRSRKFAACCSVLQRVAVCCSVLQSVAVHDKRT